MALVPAFGWRFFRHARYGLAREVVAEPVGVHREDDEDLAAVHEVRGWSQSLA